MSMKLPGLMLLVLMAWAIPSSVQSQEIDLRIGYMIPTGELGDMEDGGVTTGFSIGVPVSNSLVLGAGTAAAFLQGGDRDSFGNAPDHWPDLTALHYVAEVRFRPSVLPGWNLEVGVGAGGSTLSFSDAGSSTYPALSGALGGGVDLSKKVALLVDARTFVVFADSDDFDDLDRFGDIWLMGLAAGVRIRL